MHARWPILLLLSLVFSCGRADVNDDAASTLLQQWTLPAKLNEISGLALTGDSRLLAITDEVAIVYELDYKNGQLVKAFAFGDPVVTGDFEGIAVLDNRVWIMTSTGVLYSATEGLDGEKVEFERHDTDLGRECELEGLAASDSRNLLLMMCKQKTRDNRNLALFVYNPEDGNIDMINLPGKSPARAIRKKRIRPSGVEIDPTSGELVVLTANQRAVFRYTAAGKFIDVLMRLDSDRHQQAEGISITPDGSLLIADEAGQGRARLSVYSWNEQK